MQVFGVKLTMVRILVAAIIVAIAMAIPVIRNFIWLLLPLGSGNDDIVEGLALVVIFVVLFVEVWSNALPKYFHQKK